MKRQMRRSLEAGRAALSRPAGSSRVPVGYVPPEPAQPQQDAPGPHDVFLVGCRILDVFPSDVQADGKSREITRARGLLVAAMRRICDCAYPACSVELGRTCHSTSYAAEHREVERDRAGVAAFVAQVREQLEHNQKASCE